jgi:hypothetical protein
MDYGEQYAQSSSVEQAKKNIEGKVKYIIEMN